MRWGGGLGNRNVFAVHRWGGRMTQTPDPSPRKFNEEFRQSFRDLILWRRDVRRFRRDPIDPLLMHSLLELASYAPSVGHCQLWRVMLLHANDRRESE